MSNANYQQNSDNSKRRSCILNYEQYELLIPGYPKDSDITVINTSYVPRYRDEEGKVEMDYISILFRDNTTGAKMVHIIYEPLYTFYAINDNIAQPNHNLFFTDKDNVHPVTCKYADLTKALAEVTGRLDEYYDNIRSEIGRAHV